MQLLHAGPFIDGQRSGDRAGARGPVIDGSGVVGLSVLRRRGTNALSSLFHNGGPSWGRRFFLMNIYHDVTSRCFTMKHKLTGWAGLVALILTIPVAAFPAAALVRLNIGTASVTSSALTLWIAQEQGFFKKQGVETRTILVRGGTTLVGSLVVGDIDLAFTTGVPILGAATQGTGNKNAHHHD